MLRFNALLGTEGGEERVIFGFYWLGIRPIGFYLAVKVKGIYRRRYWLPKQFRSRRYDER